MTAKELAEALRSGRRAYGTLVVSPSPQWCGLVGKIGIDFVFIDTEHVPIDRHTLAWMCQAYKAMNIAPIVRIPSPDPFQACMVLDGGADGIIAPYIESAEQVQQLRGVVRMRPVKGRKLTDAIQGTRTFEPELQEYLDGRNENNLLIINVESVPALESLDEILAVPGLDGVIVGPHDLTCSLGIPEKYDHPKFINTVDEIISKARAAGVAAGVHFWSSIQQEIDWAKKGANIILHSADGMVFQRVMHEELSSIRNALGDRIYTAEGARETEI